MTRTLGSIVGGLFVWSALFFLTRLGTLFGGPMDDDDRRWMDRADKYLIVWPLKGGLVVGVLFLFSWLVFGPP